VNTTTQMVTWTLETRRKIGTAAMHAEIERATANHLRDPRCLKVGKLHIVPYPGLAAAIEATYRVGS
jgi:hypothetical protein